MSSLSLLSLHNSSEPSWERREYQYRDGLEISVVPANGGNLTTRAYDVDANRRTAARRRSLGDEGASAGDGPMNWDRDYREEAAKRARRRIRRVVRSHQLRVLDTFTFSRSGVKDREQALKLWSSFVHRNRELLFHGRAYVYVGEKMKNGSWHIHVARAAYRRGPRELAEIHTKWRNHLERAGILAVGEFGGWWQSGKHTYASPRHCAAYLSKYISKDLGEGVEAGRHRYEVGEGFAPIEPVRLFYGDRYTALLLGPDLRFMSAHYDGWARDLPFFWGIWEAPD